MPVTYAVMRRLPETSRLSGGRRCVYVCLRVRVAVKSQFQRCSHSARRREHHTAALHVSIDTSYTRIGIQKPDLQNILLFIVRLS